MALTASAGIAPNTMLAKVCSDQNKPNGQYQINSTIEAVKSFISTLPVKKVSGIGPVQGQILNSIGVVTCADMWSKRDLIGYLFSSKSAEFYMEVALGIGSITVKRDYVRKSIGTETTFREIHKPEELHKKCKELCEDLVRDLKSHGVMGKVIILKMKNTSFETRTRNHSLKYYTADREIIYTTAKKLLDTEIAAAAPQPLKLRLMGIRMCNVVDEDSISSSEKQQSTLKSFLKSKVPVSLSPSKSKETLTCPVCLQKFAHTFAFYDVHVNSCLKEPDFVDIESLVSREEIGECEQNDLSVTFWEAANPDTESTNYFCPVCELCPDVENMTELNQHIDRCLNKGTCNLAHKDSSSSSERKQMKLNSFLRSAFCRKPKETLTCPACLKEFATTFSFFNDHVNSCLEKHNICDNEAAATLEDDDNNIGFNPTTQAVSGWNLSCPVCAISPVVKDLAELNQHIDSCLNKGAIKEILAGDLKRKIENATWPFKRSKPMRKEKKIHEYFK